MARIYANINKKTVSFICSQIGVTSTFIAQRTGLPENKVKEWLDIYSDTYPTLNQAKNLAKVLKVPFAGLYMHKDNLPIKRLPMLRNLRTMPYSSRDDSSLNLAVVELIRYHDFLASAEAELDIIAAPLALPSIPDFADVVGYAKLIRTYFELELNTQFKLTSPRQFYLYVRQQIENKGIFVHCFSGVDAEIARGIAIFNNASPIIGINDNDRYPAKTFSIIHELVHILKQQSTLCNEMFSSFSSQSEEVFCNAVAGEVLVPTISLNVVLTANKPSSLNLYDIDRIAKKYSVSKEVITRRLYDTNRISKDEYDTYTDEIYQDFLLKRESDKIARQEGRKQIFPNIARDAADKNSPAICRTLLIGYGEGYFSTQEVSGILGIKEKHITKFLKEVAKW